MSVNISDTGQNISYIDFSTSATGTTTSGSSSLPTSVASLMRDTLVITEIVPIATQSKEAAQTADELLDEILQKYSDAWKILASL